MRRHRRWDDDDASEPHAIRARHHRRDDGGGDDASIVVSRFVHAWRFEIRVHSSGDESWDVPSDDASRYLAGRWERDWFFCWNRRRERGRKITLGPTVKAKPNQKQIEFIAKDATTFVRRVLLEEELAALNKGGGIPQVRDSILRSSLSSSSNTEHAEYDREQLARLATSKHMLNAYMTQNIGSFPDVIESLISRHEFVKKDETSALVACEFYINREEFTNKWARPYAINARTLRRFENRESEARDAARIFSVAQIPWWWVRRGKKA